MRARYYNPLLMRFINADPIGFAGGSNWYAYAGNNPLLFLDPTGLWSWSQTWGVLKAIGGAIELGVGVAAGVATSWTGIGAVAGAAATVHGADTFQAGIRQAYSGKSVDTFTSQGMQAVGVPPNVANVADAGVGMALTMGATAAIGATKTAGGLVHMTTETAKTEILASDVLHGKNGIYAGPAANKGASGIGITLRTGVSPANTADVPIPQTAISHFTSVKPVGPISGWQFLTGQVYTAPGSLTLSTGSLTLTKGIQSQYLFYGLDAAMTTVYGFGRYLEAGGCGR
jgi:hypothetical protein